MFGLFWGVKCMNGGVISPRRSQRHGGGKRSEGYDGFGFKSLAELVAGGTKPGTDMESGQWAGWSLLRVSVTSVVEITSPAGNPLAGLRDLQRTG